MEDRCNGSINSQRERNIKIIECYLIKANRNL